MNSTITKKWLVITDRNGLLELEGQWRSLEAQSNGGTPFQSFSWCHQWLKHRGKSYAPYILIRADQQLIAPFAITLTGRSRFLRLIGTGDSDYLGLVTTIASGEAWEAVIAALHERRNEWHILHLQSVKQKGDIISALGLYKDFSVIEREYEKCPVLWVTGTWESYLQRMKKVRYETRRWSKRVHEMGAVTLEPISLPVSPTLLEEMIDVERDSWKWELGTAALKPGEQAEFISAVLQDPLMPARVWCLRTDGKLVAFAVVLEDSAGWYYYLPSFRGSCPNAGAHLLSCIVEEAFKNGRVFVDFLQGNHGYKALWSDDTVGVAEILTASSLRGSIVLQGYVARWAASRSDVLRRLRNVVRKVGDRREMNHVV